MSRIVLTNQSSTPDDAGSGNAQLFIQGNELHQQVGTNDKIKLTLTPGISALEAGDTSFVAPNGCTFIEIELWGGGGSGARGGNYHGGGGGGAYCFAGAVVTPGTSYTTAVGSGALAKGSQGNGSSGGNTTFTVGGTTYTANGGGGGTEAGSFSTTHGGAGGTASNGILNKSGQKGGWGEWDEGGHSGGASPCGGGGGIGSPLNSHSATNLGAGAGDGCFPGGGGGAARDAASGAGADGLILVRFMREL